MSISCRSAMPHAASARYWRSACAFEYVAIILCRQVLVQIQKQPENTDQLSQSGLSERLQNEAMMRPSSAMACSLRSSHGVP